MIRHLRRFLARWRIGREEMRAASEKHTCAAQRVQDVAKDMEDKSKADRDKMLEKALDEALRALERKPPE